MPPCEPAAFEQAWAAGRAVPLEEAITEALTIADEVATAQTADRSTHDDPDLVCERVTSHFFDPPVATPSFAARAQRDGIALCPGTGMR